MTAKGEMKKSPLPAEEDDKAESTTAAQSVDEKGQTEQKEGELGSKEDSANEDTQSKLSSTGKKRANSGSAKSSPTAGPSSGAHVAATGEPKVIKKGDTVITNYVDEKTGKIAVYEIGIKLEVSDFSQPPKWFPARVVEIDSGENEILAHFDNWSTRFDEWIKMDSNRLRPAPNTNIVKTTFKVGEKVEAIWGMDGQKYPGEILSVLPNDFYQVLFDDGIRYKKKYNQIFKLKMNTRGSSGRLSTDAPTTPPMTQPKSARPLPKLTPAPYLLGPDGSNFNQQPVSSLPPNVPLLANAPPGKGKRVERQLSFPVAVQMRDRTHQDLGPLSAPHSYAAETSTSQSSKSFSVFESVPTDLGKRRRTVKNYSQLLNPNLRLSPPPSSSNTGVTGRRRTSSKIVADEKFDSSPFAAGEPHSADTPTKLVKVPQMQKRKSLNEFTSASTPPSAPSKGQTKAGGRKSHLAAQKEIAQIECKTPSQKQLVEVSSADARDSLATNLIEVSYITLLYILFTATYTKIEHLTRSSGQSTPDSSLTHSKRKRTIHDYSMLLKSRIPRSFVPDSDSPPKTTRRRRRRNVTLEQDHAVATDVGQTEDDLESKSTDTHEVASEEAPFSTVTNSNKATSKIKIEQESEPSIDSNRRTDSSKRVKQAPVLMEFDMFAPKPKKGVVPYRNVPEKVNKENSAVESTDHGKRQSVSAKVTSGELMKYEDEELLDLPDDCDIRIKEEQDEEKSQPPPPVIHRRPGRPFKKNKPPPGHWSYGFPTASVSASSSSSSTSTTSTTVTSLTTAVPKTSPPVAHHPASRLMKNLKIPIVPINTVKESNDLLSGLSTTKIEKIQRKLLEYDLEFPEFEPALKDPSVDVINCACGTTDEHGFMIQCEFCHCWQHGSCHGFTEDSEMPSFYVCETCRFPHRPRNSLKYEWNQEFKRKGRLPILTMDTEPDVDLEHMILESAELQDRIYQILDIVHSNKVKLHIANKLPEHPKIYQWDKPSVPPSDDLKIRLYKKVYNPVLRRLLYHHRHEEGYKEHLIQQVERKFNPDAVDPNPIENKNSNRDTEAGPDRIEDVKLKIEIEETSTSTKSLKNLVEESTSAELSQLDELDQVEVKDVLEDLISKVENAVPSSSQQQSETDQTVEVARPTELSLLDDSEKSGNGNDSEKKGTTPLADDLSMLGNIGELTSKADPAIDDLFMSIFNDPDFEKSFDAPMAAGASSFATMKDLLPAPPVSTPVIVPTLERITPDMCRANLLKHVADQQEVVDKCLQIVEDKISAMEQRRLQGIPPTYLDNVKLSQLQMSVQRLLSAFELLKGMRMGSNSQSHSGSQSPCPTNENEPPPSMTLTLRI